LTQPLRIQIASDDVVVTIHESLPQVHGQDLRAPLQVGRTHKDAAREAARAQQRGVQRIRPVGKVRFHLTVCSQYTSTHVIGSGLGQTRNWQERDASACVNWQQAFVQAPSGTRRGSTHVHSDQTVQRMPPGPQRLVAASISTPRALRVKGLGFRDWGALPVGGGQDQHPPRLVEPIHLHQQLRTKEVEEEEKEAGEQESQQPLRWGRGGCGTAGDR